MTLTAHVPPYRNPPPGEAQTFEPVTTNPFVLLGDRLVQLGLALQRAETTIGELTAFAEASGLSISIKVVEGHSRADET